MAFTVEEKKKIKSLLKKSREDWNFFARKFLGVRLDKEQREILHAIQHNRRVSIRSGTARGKDFVSAVAAICFLYLTPRKKKNGEFEATKVILTAPTGRQIRNIMIPEVSKMFQKLQRFSDIKFDGDMLSDGIRVEDQKDWFLTGFKASDENVEAWSGLHAPNIMVIVTEASGIAQTTFDSIEGILQGNSRLVIVFNPNSTAGEAYNSTRSPLYKRFKLNCIESPNVQNKIKLINGLITPEEYKKLHIPGQVDYEWVDEKIQKPGWVIEITKEQMNDAFFDFEWNGKYYRPGKLARVKILGEFPEESDDVLIPLSWIEAANDRWREMVANPEFTFNRSKLRLGVDVAGMGRDNTNFAFRYDNFVEKIETQALEKTEVIHMRTAGKIKQILKEHEEGYAFIDTIGEGAGVHSRLIEQGVKRAISCKFSHGAGDLTDVTGEYQFANMRAYLFWALRDALNPAHKFNLALPPNDDLTQGLTEIKYIQQSNGKIIIEPKEDIKQRLGRSIDYEDALANTFYPDSRIQEHDDDLEDVDEINF